MERANGILIFLQWGAYANVTVKIGFIKLLQKQFDICEEACVLSCVTWLLPNAGPHPSENANATLRCPVQSDDYVIVQTVALPKEIPKGKSIL
jgi:hypothetical protein